MAPAARGEMLDQDYLHTACHLTRMKAKIHVPGQHDPRAAHSHSNFANNMNHLHSTFILASGSYMVPDDMMNRLSIHQPLHYYPATHSAVEDTRSLLGCVNFRRAMDNFAMPRFITSATASTASNTAPATSFTRAKYLPPLALHGMMWILVFCSNHRVYSSPWS